MTKYKAKIILSEKAYNTIKWLTLNFEKEIGALGIGDVIDGIVYVDKLVFPRQKVTHSHVHFSPDDWDDILKETTVEEQERIIFYWHKHPGYSTIPSDGDLGDEGGTFDVFMAPEAGRKIFAFLITAQKSYNSTEMEYMGRIEIRDPVIATLDADVVSEILSDVEEECKKIIATKIYEDPEPIKVVNNWDTKTSLIERFSTKSRTLEDYSNVDDYFMEITSSNGLFEIKVGSAFKKKTSALFSKGGEKAHLVNKMTTLEGDNLLTIKLVPAKKKYDELKECLSILQEAYDKKFGKKPTKPEFPKRDYY